MKFWLKILSPILALSLAACHGSAPEADSDVLKAVPSRAVAVGHFGRADKALALLTDSTSVFRQIDFGSMHSNEASLSWVFSANLVPVLAIEAGKGDGDTTSTAAKVISRAQELGLHCCHSGDALKRAVLIISPLQSVVDEALAHIEAQTSVLDAPGFAEANKLAEGEAGTLFLRGSAAFKWMPKDFLKGIFPRIATASMISTFSDWFVADFDSYSTEKVSVKCLKDNVGNHYSSVIGSIPGGDMKIASFLPEDFALFIDLPIDNAKKYAEAWASYLDARALHPANKVKSNQIAKANGISPEAWAAKYAVKEVATVARVSTYEELEEVPGRRKPKVVERIKCARVLLVRAGNKSALPKLAGPNECPGATGVLYGKLFRLDDESFCAPSGHWLVIGAEDDVLSYLESAGRVKLPDLPKSDCKFAVCAPDWQIACEGDEIGLKIWN